MFDDIIETVVSLFALSILLFGFYSFFALIFGVSS